MTPQEPEDDLAPIPLVGDDDAEPTSLTPPSAGSSTSEFQDDLSPIPLAGEESEAVVPSPAPALNTPPAVAPPQVSAEEERSRRPSGSRREPWTAPEVARDPQLPPMDRLGDSRAAEAASAEVPPDHAARPSDAARSAGGGGQRAVRSEGGRASSTRPAAPVPPETGEDDGPLELVELMAESAAPPPAEAASRSLTAPVVITHAAAGTRADSGGGASKRTMLLALAGGGGALVVLVVVLLIWLGDGGSQPVTPGGSTASTAALGAALAEEAMRTPEAAMPTPQVAPEPAAPILTTPRHAAVVISENSQIYFQRLAGSEPLPEDVPAAANMRQIAVALQAFLQQNGGRWPERLMDLRDTLPNFDQVMRHPRTGEREGFVFEPPLDRTDPGATPILWEARSGFRDPQGAVLYADGRIARQ